MNIEDRRRILLLSGLQSTKRFEVTFLNVSLITQELGAHSLSAAVSLSLGSLDSVSVSLERLVTCCVVLLLYHFLVFFELIEIWVFPVCGEGGVSFNLVHRRFAIFFSSNSKL